ncbi:DUF2628 domain-containing protein [Candidatus Pacearchaeota archaeon]|nr:DUF2628 domain-containing protein [Candidatus Pacearchaeota archaeon]
MARKKARKSKRTSGKISRSVKSTQKQNSKFKGFSAAKLLFNLIFISVIIFGIYIIWTRSWLEGIGVIFIAVMVYLLIKLIANLRKK